MRDRPGMRQGRGTPVRPGAERGDTSHDACRQANLRERAPRGRSVEPNGCSLSTRCSIEGKALGPWWADVLKAQSKGYGYALDTRSLGRQAGQGQDSQGARSNQRGQGQGAAAVTPRRSAHDYLQYKHHP